MGNGKNHKCLLSASWNYQSLTSNLIMLYNSVSFFLGSHSTVHRLCFLQIWGKWARGGRSIQARQSEWPMTVQNRRKLEKCVSTLQPGWTEGSNRAESAPEVDTGEQGARGQ